MSLFLNNLAFITRYYLALCDLMMWVKSEMVYNVFDSVLYKIEYKNFVHRKIE